MKASVIFFPYPSKKNSKNGKIPLYMRVIFKREKTENRLNAEITESDLLKWDPMTMRIKERNNPLNHHLNRLEQQYHVASRIFGTLTNVLTSTELASGSTIAMMKNKKKGREKACEIILLAL